MNFPMPPNFLIISTPGRNERMKALEMIALAPMLARSSGEMCLTVVFVATGIKNGVSISPDFVCRMPARALLVGSFATMVNTSCVMRERNDVRIKILGFYELCVIRLLFPNDKLIE